MTIDWNIAFIETLKAGKFPQSSFVKERLQWIDNRLGNSLSWFHNYCYYTRKNTRDNSDLEKIENDLTEIIIAASDVLKIVRVLREDREEIVMEASCQQK